MFESAEDVFELLAELATVCVIVGLILEYTPPVLARYKKSWYERSPFWKFIVHLLGPVLVVLGISGELLFHHKTNVSQKETITALVKRIAPRSFDFTKCENQLAVMKQFPAHAQIMYVADAPDGERLAFGLRQVLAGTGWDIPAPKAIVPENGRGAAAAKNAAPYGLTLVSGGIMEPKDATLTYPSSEGRLFAVLACAYSDGLGEMNAYKPIPELDAHEILIVIAPRQ